MIEQKNYRNKYVPTLKAQKSYDSTGGSDSYEPQGSIQ